MNGLGVDIVRISRFENMISESKKYKKILSVRETEIFENLTKPDRRMEFLAGRFAAKEAVFKSLSKSGESFTFPEISVLGDAAGALEVTFARETKLRVLVSISHSEENAVAVAVLN